MDFQEQKVAEARVISGDCRLSRANFEKLVYGFGELGADSFALDYFYGMRSSSLATSRRCVRAAMQEKFCDENKL